jgi:protein TonB
LFLLSSFIFQAQKNKDAISVYDKDWKPCHPSKAVYMAVMTRLDESTFQWNYYHFAGPLINIESYKDYKSTIPNGYFAWFDSSGRLDSSGYSLLGRKDGHWNYYTDKMSVKTTDEYENGRLIKHTDWDKVNKDKKEGDIPAEFRGGSQAWKTYLTRNIRFPDRAQKNSFQGNVIVEFIVDTSGKIASPHVIKSVEYSLDQEALRIVTEAPAWTPAMKDGQKTRAYLRQPVTFRSYTRQN